MRILITGATGFVGPHLMRALTLKLGQEASLAATAKHAGHLPGFGAVMPLDVTDEGAVDRVVREMRPTAVVHLAAVSSIAGASADAMAAWTVNTFRTLNLAHAILRHAPHCWLIFAGSGLAYGDTAKRGRPLDEAAPLAPNTDYGVTKAAADLALGALAGRGLNTIRFRPFNHTGPGQSEEFVVASFAAQIARIEAGLQPPVLRVGNLDAMRDFLDVRDVVAAYAMAVAAPAKLTPGLILNIASGRPRSIRSILDGLLSLSRVPIAIELDPARLRPSDIPVFSGNVRAARQILGWRPRHAFSDTLASVLADWRRQIGET